MSLDNLTPKQLRQAASLKEQIHSLENKLAKLVGGSASAAPTNGRRKKRRMSAEARAKISAAQKRRWAKQKSK